MEIKENNINTFVDFKLIFVFAFVVFYCQDTHRKTHRRTVMCWTLINCFVILTFDPPTVSDIERLKSRYHSRRLRS